MRKNKRDPFDYPSIFDKGRIADVTTFRGSVIVLIISLFIVVAGWHWAVFLRWMDRLMGIESPAISENKTEWFGMTFGIMGGYGVFISLLLFVRNFSIRLTKNRPADFTDAKEK